MIYKDIEKQVEKLRKKLHMQIEKSGIDNEKTIKISEKLDNLIKEYYLKKLDKEIEYNLMYLEYKIAYNYIKKLTKKTGKFPTTKEWNKIAKKEIYLNNKSVEYIGGISWNKLKAKILLEINTNSYK